MGSILKSVKNNDKHRKEVLDFVVKKFRKNKKVSVKIVFDGFPEKYISHGLSLGNVEIVFSQSITADMKIISMLKKTDKRENIVVITSDMALQREVKKLGANAITCREFLSRKSEKEEEILSPEKINPTSIDVKFWMDFFKKGGDNSPKT